MQMVGRKWSLSGSYRYGFNGQEKSDEIAGEGNHNTAEFWEYDPRIGRRWNLDPVSRTSISDYSALGNNPVINVDPNGALFFGLFGSTSEQRQAAKSFANSSGGEVRNKWSSKIHVNYDQSSIGSDGVFTVTNSNQRFRRNGRLELGSAIANQEYDKQYEYEISHGTDKNGKRYYMPASGRAEYVPVESILVPLPPVLAIAQEYKMVSFFSVQGAADAARLLKGGTLWPTAALRGQWGEGLYAWGTKAEAQHIWMVI